MEAFPDHGTSREEVLGRILEESQNEIYVFDADTLRFIQVNRGARKNLGYTQREVKRLTPLDIKPEFSRNAFFELVRPLLRGKKKMVQFNTVHQRKDGTTYPVEVHLQLADLDTKPVFVAIILDISERERVERERRELEDQVRHTQKLQAIGTLAGGIAHDFNNLLHGISCYIGAVRQNLPQDSEEFAYLSEALDLTAKGGKLARQILTYGRRQDIKGRVFNVLPEVKSVCAMADSTLPSKVRVTSDFRIEDDRVYGDPGQIQQIILNLCINAGEAMKEAGGSLHVRLANEQLSKAQARPMKLPPGNYLKLMVRDTGPGIEPEHIHRLFEPYFSSKPAEVGAGMGLAIVEGIVRSHRGQILVESETGRGATFLVYLPVADAAAGDGVTEDPVPPADDSEPDSARHKVLLVR